MKTRRFVLLRLEDETGISGPGVVCDGVQFPSGKCVMEWNSATTSIGFYESIDRVLEVHGHGGKTQVIWVDAPGGSNPTMNIPKALGLPEKG